MAGKVVIYRLGTLGDTVVALPCFHLIAQAFPNAARFILTNEVPSSAIAQPLSILSGSGLVHDLIAYPIGLRSPSRLLNLARTLRSLGADTLIYLTESRGIARTLRDVAFFRFAGFTRVIGAPSREILHSIGSIPLRASLNRSHCASGGHCMNSGRSTSTIRTPGA